MKINKGALVPIFAQFHMHTNATTTPIAGVGIYVKVLGTTSSGDFIRSFDVTTTSNKAVYTGSKTCFFHGLAVGSVVSGNNKLCSIGFAKNGVIDAHSVGKATTNSGGKADTVVSQDVFQLSNGDYLEIYVTNETDTTAVTLEQLNVCIKKIS